MCNKKNDKWSSEIFLGKNKMIPPSEHKIRTECSKYCQYSWVLSHLLTDSMLFYNKFVITQQSIWSWHWQVPLPLDYFSCVPSNSLPLGPARSHNTTFSKEIFTPVRLVGVVASRRTWSYGCCGHWHWLWKEDDYGYYLLRMRSPREVVLDWDKPSNTQKYCD